MNTKDLTILMVAIFIAFVIGTLCGAIISESTGSPYSIYTKELEPGQVIVNEEDLVSWVDTICETYGDENMKRCRPNACGDCPPYGEVSSADGWCYPN